MAKIYHIATGCIADLDGNRSSNCKIMKQGKKYWIEWLNSIFKWEAESKSHALKLVLDANPWAYIEPTAHFDK